MKIYLKPRHAGIAVIILGIAIFFVILSFTTTIQGLNQYLHKDCPLPEEICPYRRSIPVESVVGFVFDFILIGVGVILIIEEREEKKAESRKKYTEALKTMDEDEKKIFGIVTVSGAVFQNELIEKTGFSKAKVTRVLDRMEGKGLIERRRRGMSNIVVQKQT